MGEKKGDTEATLSPTIGIAELPVPTTLAITD